MIGTGASGHQVGAHDRAHVERLMIFPRSPHWVCRTRTITQASARVRMGDRQRPFYLRWYRFQLFWVSPTVFTTALQVDPGWARSRPIPERAQ